MNCIELSLKELKDECISWAQKISNEYSPDLLVYVANAGYPIAVAMQEVFRVPIIGIEAQRGGNSIKSKVGKFFSHIPSFLRNILIAMELKSGIHAKNTERSIKWIDAPEEYLDSVESIMIIDDSVDSGITLCKVLDEVKVAFPNATIKTVGLNVWDKSRQYIETDYCLYRNTIIKAPMSKDSKEYEVYLNMLPKK